MTSTLTITGDDIRNPHGAAVFLSDLAAVFGDLTAQAELFRSNQIADGVSGAPIGFLAAMEDRWAAVASALGSAADRAYDHCNRVAETVGSDDSLAGTQTGGYADVAAL